MLLDIDECAEENEEDIRKFIKFFSTRRETSKLIFIKCLWILPIPLHLLEIFRELEKKEEIFRLFFSYNVIQLSSVICCAAIIKSKRICYWRVFYRPFRNASENLVHFDLRFLPVRIFAFHVPLKWLHILTVYDWFVWHKMLLSKNVYFIKWKIK